MNTTGMNKRTFAIVAVVLAVVVFFVTIALMGGGQGRSAGATVTFVGPEGATIYVGTSDDEGNVVPRETYQMNGGETNVSVEPGEVAFIASRGDTFYPWEKTLSLDEGDETSVYPLMLPQEAELESTDDNAVTEAFATPATLPTSADPKTASENGEGLETYVDGQALVVEWSGEVEDMPEFFCPAENVADCLVQQVLSFEDFGPIENVEFFGADRQFLMIDQGDTISVVEIDRRGRQNRQPLYVGTTPAFRIVDGEVYITDGGEIWHVELPEYMG